MSSDGHHHCSGKGCGHDSHAAADATIGLRPARIPTPMPSQPLPPTAAMAIHGVRSRLAIREGSPLPQDAPRMFLRAVPTLGDEPRLLRLHELVVELDPDSPTIRARLTNQLRERTGLGELRPVRGDGKWTYEFGIEAVLDPAIAAAIWLAAAQVPEVVSARMLGYSSAGLWTVENGLEHGTFRIVMAGPIAETMRPADDGPDQDAACI